MLGGGEAPSPSTSTNEKRTRLLGQRPANESSVTFDKVGDAYYLAEVYISGSDGYHLQGAPGPHTHVKVGSHSGTK